MQTPTNKQLYQLIAEQQAHILELNDALEAAEQTIQALLENKKVKRLKK